jgi:hypothetical protein
MIQIWKLPHILKGTLTYLPPLNAWRLHGSTGGGGTNSPQYCYSIWHRNSKMLREMGFDPAGVSMVELGPGDTIGVGLTALLYGIRLYTALDVLPCCRSFNPVQFFDEIVTIAAADQDESRRPTIPEVEIRRIRADLACGLTKSKIVRYVVPWGATSVYKESTDLVHSMGALQYVDRLEETYQAMFSWLRPGGYGFHFVDCSAHYMSPFWNGHWAYSDLEWRLVRGRRGEVILNRLPFGVHVKIARAAGFEVLLRNTVSAAPALPRESLAARFRTMDDADSSTCRGDLVLRKPK